MNGRILGSAFAAAVAIISVGEAAAQTAPTAPYRETGPSQPVHIPASGGEVILPSQGDQHAYDTYKFAAARRVGDTLYISGVIAAVPAGKKADAETYKTQLRSAFRRIDRTLKASGASFADVVMINSFHVWDSPWFEGGRDAQFAAFSAVKDEFMPAPHPAWTAVGTTGLLADTGLVEIQMIVHVPAKS
ncbi:RidA family protein [Caulobacter sp. 17J80-11]|uniref:RidA family protein n=1 Tax=Caulobacter sp. 17J80-11 TaxID=2763502 RepID=UPI001653AE99|nr:RidA family protein [Caulobacter sp. 17J80-11]MBC6980441.1 RidA family protein [Caulobacter sp. 17J80-11]